MNANNHYQPAPGARCAAQSRFAGLSRRLRCATLLAGLAQLCALPAAHATVSSVYAAPAAQGIPGAAGGTLRVVLALIVVLGAVFAAAWLSRRVNGSGRLRSGGLALIAQLSLGPRERAVLIRVGSQQLLLGVTSGSVRTLHVLPSEGSGDSQDSAIAIVPSDATRPSFKALLLKSLGK